MPRYVTLEAKQGGYWLRFDFDPEIVADLKQLPYWTRKWNPEMRAWWIHPDWIDNAKQVIERRARPSDFGRWKEDDDYEDASGYDTFDDFAKGRKDTPPPCFAKLYLLPEAPLEVARAAYGALAKLNHPDTTIDPTEKQTRHKRMVEINDAWTQAETIIKARR
jgi:hypothetical protein